MLFTSLLVVHAIIAALLVTVILMQRSEGGGLTSGGSPSGLMSARGAADFLTRATRWLAVVFVVLSIVLASLAVNMTGTDSIESTLDRNVTPAAPADPLAQGGAAAPAQQGDAGDQGDAADPLAGATE